MRVLLTNDDGYDQPGLKALYNATLMLGEAVTVAPTMPHSSCGHQVTMASTLTVTELKAGYHRADGTPADCIRLGLKEIAPTTDWVLAGINPGANLGSDVYQSGTVAAAREAAILGVSSVAISHYIAPKAVINWDLATEVVHNLLQNILPSPLERGYYLNINLPSPLTMNALNNIQYCPHDTQPHNYDFIQSEAGFRYSGIIHDRPYKKNTDIDACFSGSIAVTLLQL